MYVSGDRTLRQSAGSSIPHASTGVGAPGQVVRAGITKEHLNRALGLFVATFTEVLVADAALCVGEVQRGPELVRECVPDRVVVVDRDRVLEVQLVYGPTHAVDVVLDLRTRASARRRRAVHARRTCPPTRGRAGGSGAS